MDILQGGNSAETIAKNILKGFSNVDEIVKSEEQASLEKAISEGNLKVVTESSIDENYGGKFYTKENIAKAQAEVDALIVKGETDFLTEEEFAFVKSTQEDISSLEEVIVKGDDGAEILGRVFVQEEKSVEETEEEEEA